MTKKIAFLLSLAILFLAIHPAAARSGCCSHHGGVCGCGCCDGSALSVTCAPYYPTCSSASTPASLVIPTTPPTPASNTTKIKKPIRSKNKALAKIIGSTIPNQKYTILHQDKTWIQIKINQSTRGWIPIKSVTKIKP